MDPAVRLTASSETDAEPSSDTDVIPAGLIWAVTDWDGALTDQPSPAGAMPETRGAVPTPIGPCPSRAWMARASPAGTFWTVEWAAGGAVCDAAAAGRNGMSALAAASIVAKTAQR